VHIFQNETVPVPTEVGETQCHMKPVVMLEKLDMAR